MKKTVSIVIPVFNESGNIIPMIEKLSNSICDSYHYEIIFVDDGSTDDTLEQLKSMTSKNNNIFYISLSRNFGHQNALKAGLDKATGDCVISLDGDLQHPPELIPAMLKFWETGSDIVYTRRCEDKRLSFVKRYTSNCFSKFMKLMSGMPIEQGVADFRLLDRKVVNVISNLQEPDLFLRGVVYWMGFRKQVIDYTPAARLFGETKYSVSKMFRLAIQGITSFSVKPLYMSIILGLIFSLTGIIYFIYVLWCVFAGLAVAGWASTIVTVMFFGGLNMLILGIIGIYIGKIFMQSKYRPSYIIRETNCSLIS